MSPSRLRVALPLVCIASVGFFEVGCATLVDSTVAVTSSAIPDYTRAKFGQEQIRRETYVFMVGRYFEGTTLDHSLDRLTFRKLAESMAQQLARKQYFPAKDLHSADLLVVIYWGTTKPHISVEEAHAQSAPQLNGSLPTHTYDSSAGIETPLMAGSDPTIADFYANVTSENDMRVGFDQADRTTDAFGADFDNSNNIALLGYGRQLRALVARPSQGTTEATLRSDLSSERYFIILRAYDLHSLKNGKSRVVWTLHANTRSPGHNFAEALNLMGNVAVDYFGRESGGVVSVPPKLREGKVEFGEIRIIGEKK
jgi:hypothetical protein